MSSRNHFRYIIDESMRVRRTEGNLTYTLDTDELRTIFSSEEISDPQAQLLLLDFLRGQERDVVQGSSGESGQDGM